MATPVNGVRIRAAILTSLALVAIITLPLHFQLVVPTGNKMLHEVNESGHTALFMLLQLGLIWAWLTFVPRRWNQPQKRHVMVMFVACAAALLGLSIEIIQPYFHREASWLDEGRNCLGIIAGSALYWSVQRRVDGMGKLRIWPLPIAVLCVLLGFSTVFYWAVAQQKRDTQFPILSNFEFPVMDRYLTNYSSARFAFEVAPSEWGANGSRTARLFFADKPKWNGFLLQSPIPHWGGYKTLKFDLFSLEAEPVRIGVSLLAANQNHKPVIRGVYMILPGENHLALPLNGEKDVGAYEIADIVWFSATVDKNFTLWMDNVRLE